MKNKDLYIVYKICDPETMDCVYVGMSKDFSHRIANHMNPNLSCEKSLWVKSVLSRGKKPVFTTDFLTTSKFEARVEEARIIGEMKSKGFSLFNKIEELDHSPFDKKPVIDQNGKVYKSVSHAYRETGCPRKGIRMTIDGTQESTKGFSFRWCENFELIKAVS